MGKMLGAIILFFYSTLVAADLLTFIFPSAGRLGVFLWTVNYFSLFILSVVFIYLLIRDFFRMHTTAVIFVLLVWFVVVGFNLKIPYNLSGETTLEIGCYLNHFKTGADWGYHDTCLFGYPAKQYIVPALPTILLGNSITALHLGGSIYFITGIIIFSYGVKKYIGSHYGDIAAALLLSSIFHIHYVNHFLLFFEQSIFPFSFGLILCGLFFLYVSEKKIFWLAWTGFTLQLLIFSYTPGLALFLLAMLIGIGMYRISIPPVHKKILLFILLNSILTFVISLIIRNDIQITDSQTTFMGMLNDLGKGLYHIFIFPTGTPYVSPFMQTLLVGTLLLLVIKGNSPVYLLIFFWTFSVLSLAAVAKGYTYYAMGFRFHRAIVIFPVLLSVCTVLWKQSALSFKISFGYVLIAITLLTGLLYQDTTHFVEKGGGRGKQYMLINWLQTKVPPDSDYRLVTFGDKDNSYVSTGDLLTYFFPDMSHVSYPDGQCQLITDKHIIVVNILSECYEYYTQNNTEIPETYTDNTDTFGIFFNPPFRVSQNHLKKI